MDESQLKTIIESNFEKLIATGMRGVFPFTFTTSPSPKKQYTVDSAIVNNQVVFSTHIQIILFLIMDLPSILAAAQKLFPKMTRNESLKMVVSANNEIINAASSKLAMLLSRTESKPEVIITPPLVTNQTGENRVFLNVSECLFWTFQASGIAFEFIVTIQALK